MGRNLFRMVLALVFGEAVMQAVERKPIVPVDSHVEMAMSRAEPNPRQYDEWLARSPRRKFKVWQRSLQH